MKIRFYGYSDKAQRELGWRPRPLAGTFRDVLHSAGKLEN
jgi:hypothetical protein